MKTKTKLQNLTYWLGMIAIGLMIGLSLQFARAWVEPTAAPPTGNVFGPLTTGPVHQEKDGNLEVKGNLNVEYGKRWLNAGSDGTKGTCDDVFDFRTSNGPDATPGTCDDVYADDSSIYMNNQRLFGTNNRFFYYDSFDNEYASLVLRNRSGEKLVSLHGQGQISGNPVDWNNSTVNAGVMIQHPFTPDNAGEAYILATQANNFTEILVPDFQNNNRDNPIIRATVDGKVGINTRNPSTALHVADIPGGRRGNIRADGFIDVGTTSAACNANRVGAIKEQSGKLYGCVDDGGYIWKEFGGGGNQYMGGAYFRVTNTGVRRWISISRPGSAYDCNGYCESFGPQSFPGSWLDTKLNVRCINGTSMVFPVPRKDDSTSMLPPLSGGDYVQFFVCVKP